MNLVDNKRFVAHLDLDTFFVSVERLKNSKFIGKPLIVGGMSDRAVVSACSYETRKFGVHSAMPMKLALRLCPHAIVVQIGRASCRESVYGGVGREPARCRMA